MLAALESIRGDDLTSPGQQKRDTFARLASALFVVASAVALLFLGAFEPVEDRLTNLRAEILNREPTSETAIVEIDAHSLSQLRSWPWPRQYHAQAIRELDKAGASVIALDVDFSARSSSGDEELASAIRDAGHVILPIFQQKSSDQASDQRILASRPDAAFRDAWVGGVNIFPDGDGMVREYPAATFIGGTIQPSIATLVAEKDGLGDRSFEPDWAIDVRHILRFSFVDVMEGRVPPELLRGKRILIGATAIELGDRYAVPRYGVVSGVVVQALAAESLLQDRAIQRTGIAATIFGVLLIALLLSPRPLCRPARYVALCGILALAVSAGPLLIQRTWPVSVDSAVWLYAVLASAAVQAVVESRRRLRLRTQIDAESGLPNRSMLEKALASEPNPTSILVTAGIERFEPIRDGIGIASTNEMIRHSADLIGRLVGGPIYRIAPDVLAWMQPDASEVQPLVDQLHNAFRVPVHTAAGPVDVTLTLGLDRDENGSAAVLRIERALSAISSARSLGKSYQWYRGADPLLRRQLSMMGDLRQAMEERRLSLFYQPKLFLECGRIADAEALVRLHDAAGNIVLPDEFIPLAEATGAIREVTMFALRTAMADLTRWAQDGVAMRVAVNVSALDLATADFADEVDRILSEFSVPSSQLTLEITESALMRSPAEAIATLNTLRARGIRLSVDDYGTGQSTLSYLKHLPVHELKIDKAFVTSLTSNEGDAIMVRSTINLAHELGLEVVAEGIEERSTLDALKRLGCDYGQGYFISKALTSDELFALASDAGEHRSVA